MRGALSEGAPRSAGLAAAGGGSGGGGRGDIVVQYSPTLQASGSGPEAVASFERQLRDHADVLARMVDEAVRRRDRLSYSN